MTQCESVHQSHKWVSLPIMKAENRRTDALRLNENESLERPVEGIWHACEGRAADKRQSPSDGQEVRGRGYRHRGCDGARVLGYFRWSLWVIKSRNYLRVRELQNFEASNEDLKCFYPWGTVH